MSSLRAWLISGTFAAGLGAAVLSGAGHAAADTGAGTGTDVASSDSGADSARSERTARRGAAPGARPTAAAATPAPGERIAAATAAISTRVRATAPVGAAAGNRSSADRIGDSRSNAPAAPRRASVVAVPPVSAPTAPVAPSSVPVDPAKFAGTYYEQGSVKQFFSVGLVNTTATYTLNPDGTIRVQNSGNYFFNRGPLSSIVGSAVPVNATNTALNVGFSPFGGLSANPPGNYTILANAPDYSWVIVSDPSGRSGYILTRSKTISPQEYQQLLGQARSLGVTGNITPTKQFA